MIRNILHTAFTQGSIALLNLAILLLSGQYLGSEVVGKVSKLILAMAIIQSVNDMYTGPATLFHTGTASLKRVYFTGLLWTFLCTGVMNLVMDLTGEIETELLLPLLVLSYLSIIHFFHVVLVLGRENIRLYNFLNFLQPALMTAALAIQIFVFGQRGIAVSMNALYVSWTCALMVSFVCLFMLMRQDTRDRRPSFIEVLRTGAVNEIGNLAHMLSNRYNYFVLGTTALVGIYASSSALIEKVWIIGGSIAPVILTRVANRRDESSNVQVTLSLARLSLGLSMICALVVYLLPESFFTWLLGKDFYGVRSVMLYLIPGVLCISFSTVISHYFSGLGRQRVLLYANLAGLLVTLTASYPMVHRFGMHGAAMTASMSWAMQALVLTLLFWKLNGLKAGDFFTRRITSS
jgi:O-antigen/teichoic acid export membrane protein